jgi:hydrogenase nickel incorporation protein HypA/HybF
MHEASIALSILDVVQSKCKEIGCMSLASIRIRIGKAAGILPDALQFAFEGAKEGTVAKNAKLIIEIVPVGGVCCSCKKPFIVDDLPYVLACPSCGSTSFEITNGREMDIIDMETDER